VDFWFWNLINVYKRKWTGVVNLRLMVLRSWYFVKTSLKMFCARKITWDLFTEIVPNSIFHVKNSNLEFFGVVHGCCKLQSHVFWVFSIPCQDDLLILSSRVFDVIWTTLALHCVFYSDAIRVGIQNSEVKQCKSFSRRDVNLRLNAWQSTLYTLSPNGPIVFVTFSQSQYII